MTSYIKMKNRKKFFEKVLPFFMDICYTRGNKRKIAPLRPFERGRDRDGCV